MIVREGSNEWKSRENSKAAVRLCLVVENRLLRETLVCPFQKNAGITVVGQESFSECASCQAQNEPFDVLLLDSLKSGYAMDLEQDPATREQSGPKPSFLGWTRNRNASCKR